jgi:tetratricopeptide (TPR) repeat protein
MRWVVALVVIGVLALLAGTVGRKYLAQFTPPASTEPKSNERVDALIASAGRHLGAGDLEAAKAEYDKASVLSEKHPHVLLGITRIEAIRADRLWLQLRLLTPEPSPTREAAANEMRLRMGKLQAALAEATGANPDPVQLTRLQVDALRLAGETEQARKRADGMSSAASDPETAYALAALDISDTAPNWPTVLSRLETAMAGEHGVGRAQALLIYALTLSGDYDAAKRELERLSSSAVPHPLTDALSAFLKARLEAVPAEAVSAGGPSASPVASAAVPGEGASAGEADFRTHLERASKARNSGQLVQAAELYQAALRQQPQNVEALAGLADIAKRQGQTATAQSYFEQVLSRNPGFLPALMGSADIKWGEGDKAGAVALYKRIGPNNVYSEKAEQRIAQHAGSHSDAPAHPWEEGTAPAAPQPSDSSEAPHIDESDLAPQDRDPSPPHVDVSDLPE